jgi:hypothetical protein
LEGANGKSLKEIEDRITDGFERFIFERYHKLFYESYVSAPVTVDKVLHYIGSLRGSKKAIICFDGMGFQEWYCLRDFLIENGIHKFTEHAIYALLPTLTSFSRRALYCGIRSVSDLAGEQSGFKRHTALNWELGRGRSSAVFLNSLAKWRPEYLEHDYLGIIVGIIDEIAHSQVLVNEDKTLMQQSVISILPSTGIEKTLIELLSNGYSIYITSDHGSVWCGGNGYLADKYLVDDRAKRALLYPNGLLAQEFANNNDVVIFKDKETLGESVVIFPRSHEMFARKGALAITHGGIHIEEVVIPFVEVLP